MKVKPRDGQPTPAHPHMNGNLPDAEGFYHFPFITKKPIYPAPSTPGKCRYVDDFIAVYGHENVLVREMGPLNENWLASIERARINNESKEKR